MKIHMRNAGVWIHSKLAVAECGRLDERTQTTTNPALVSCAACRRKHEKRLKTEKAMIKTVMPYLGDSHAHRRS